jgi:hypothetical protein
MWLEIGIEFSQLKQRTPAEKPSLSTPAGLVTFLATPMVSIIGSNEKYVEISAPKKVAGKYLKVAQSDGKIRHLLVISPFIQKVNSDSG